MIETTHERIGRLAVDCGQPNWDSYGADPIPPQVIPLAHRMADFLDEKFCAPNNEGGIEWEWNADGGLYIVSVTFLPDDPPGDSIP